MPPTQGGLHDASSSTSPDSTERSYDEKPPELSEKAPEALHNEKLRDSQATGTTGESSVLPGDDVDEDEDTLSYSSGPPSLGYSLHNPRRERYIILFFTLLFIESGVLPLILFYSLEWGAHLSVTKNLAIITSLIGTVSGLKLTQRTFQLWFSTGHESRRPIGSARYGMDAFHVLISLTLFAFFVPLVVGSSLSPASPRTTAMALPCVMLTFCTPMLLTGLFDRRLRVPVRVSSLPPRAPLPPLTYTIVEDVVAVDGGGGLAFRHAWAHRYQSSRVMRRVLRVLALWWGLTGVALGGGLIAIAWTAPENTAYGLGYAVPWMWAIAGAVATVPYVHDRLAYERATWAAPGPAAAHRDVRLSVQLTRDAADREVERRARAERRARDRQNRLSGVSGVSGFSAMSGVAPPPGVACRDYAPSPGGSVRAEDVPLPEGRPHTPPLHTPPLHTPAPTPPLPEVKRPEAAYQSPDGSLMV
ncbi:hypothetical protein PsYK624_099340 [Phanerochaete sordida]|uniref:Uncharacterized protein n=1 Tax=Phanerochaete sordida TaxID=48140 RepID=A0A9P3GF59_9APHY|nr:hypothetical protein PsYK624_099340 [Phanerochaete sordida]